MNYELLFFKSLVLTICIETTVLIIIFRWILVKKELGISRLITAGFITSFATLPYLWFIFPYYIFPKVLYVLVSELFAILIETVIISAILRTKLTISLICSFACNLISFLTGLVIM